MIYTIEIREICMYDVVENRYLYRWDVLLDGGLQLHISDVTNDGELHADVVNTNVDKLLSYVRAHCKTPKSYHLPVPAPYKTRYFYVVVTDND